MTDIVERLLNLADEWCGACDDIHVPLTDAAYEIRRLREALGEASEYAGRLAVSLRRKHYNELPQFELLPDLYGRLTQIDNMTCGMARAALGEGK